MKSLVAVVCACLVALAIWWFVREPSTTPTTIAPTPRAAAPPATPHSSPPSPPSPPIERALIPVPDPAPPATRALTTLRGRCVDPSGQPLAGVLAHLASRTHSDARMQAWRKANDEPTPIGLQLTTGADGEFTFTFWPPPPFMFILSLHKPGTVSRHANWRALAAGDTKDLGDVILQFGTRLHGRVLDTAGVPVPDARINATRIAQAPPPRSPTEGDLSAGTGGSARSAADGSFECSSALGSGDYAIAVAERNVQQPKSLVIDGGTPETAVDIIVTPIDHAATLSGVVVDDANQPIRDVRVESTKAGPSSTTGRDGRFRLQRPAQGGADRVAIVLRARGYEPLTTNDQYAWGANDLRLTMKRGSSVDILVVAADTEAPVEEFQLRVFPDPNTAKGYDSRNYEVRTPGRHPGGRAVVAGVARGAYLVLVEPTGDTFVMSGFVPLTVGDGVAAATIRLDRVTERPLQVRFPTGLPVPGTKVQLAVSWGNEIDTETLIGPASSLGRSSARNQAFLGYEAITDAAGHAILRAGRSVRPALLLLGPGHTPLVIQQVTMASAETLVVTVSSGARVVGKIGPPAVLTEFERLGGDFLRRGRERGRPTPPHVFLQRADGGPGAKRHPREDQPAGVAADGTFEIVGAPPGTFVVCVGWYVALTDSSATSQQESLGTISLREGESTTCNLDLSRLLSGEALPSKTGR